MFYVLLIVIKIANSINLLYSYNGDMMNKIRNICLILLFISFILLALFCILNIFVWNKERTDINKQMSNINEVVNVEEVKDSVTVEKINPPQEQDTSNDYFDYIKVPFIKVNFNELLNINSDTIAWINVKGTNINYPVVQTEDNSYYLTHSFDGSFNKAGWVFMDYRNDVDNLSNNTVLYAHGRLDRTMFGSLKDVLSANWLGNKDNYVVRLSSVNYNTLWQVFSVYTIKEENYYITTGFNSDKEYSKFINTLSNRSVHKFNVDVNSDDKILTLSSCYSSTERVVLHAKLIKRDINK